MKFLSALLLFSSACYGANFADFKGTYFVTSVEGQNITAAKITIDENATDYLLKLTNIPQATVKMTEFSIELKKQTTVVESGDEAVSLKSKLENPIDIEIQDEGGYLNITWTQTTDEDSEKSMNILATRGAAHGKEIDPRVFFQPWEGYYTIQLTNGQKPKSNIASFEFDLATDPDEAGIYAPYCSPVTKVCDAGYHGFKYDFTRVFELKLKNGNTLYHVVETEGGQIRYTTFEVQGDLLIARNHQYVFSGKEFFMEHQLKKADEK